jgi:membrane protein implicated in regulation of membrane protease activity
VVVLILVLLLLAAVFGILGAVLKAALIIALAIVLAVMLLAAIGSYYVRHRWKRFQRELLGPQDPPGRRTVINVPNEADATRDRGRLPDDGPRAP